MPNAPVLPQHLLPGTVVNAPMKGWFGLTRHFGIGYAAWSLCTTKHDQATCNAAYAASVDTPAPAVAAPAVAAPAVAAAPASSLQTSDELQSEVDEFVQLGSLLEMSTSSADKDKIRDQMSDLYDKLKPLIESKYDTKDSDARALADRAIRKLTESMQQKSYLLGSDFKTTSKIHELAAIQIGNKIKDSGDKMAEKMDKVASKLEDAQGRLDTAIQSGDRYAIYQAYTNVLERRQELVTADQQYTRSMSPYMTKLSAYRSDIDDADYAAYTDSYQEIQTNFQTLINQQGGIANVQSPQQTPQNIFQNQSSANFNMSALMSGVRPISPVPFTGAIGNGAGSNLPVFNSGLSRTSGQFGQTSNIFGQCQTTPVYNGYMPVQPTCLAAPNYVLNGQANFSSVTGNPNSSGLMVFNSGRN